MARRLLLGILGTAVAAVAGCTAGARLATELGSGATGSTGSTGSTATTAPDTPTTAAPATTTTEPAPTTLPDTTTTVPEDTTTTAPPAPVEPVDAAGDGTLERGEEGPAVLALQQRLTDLGYWLGEPDGTYGSLTAQAVMAFQKYEGLARDGVAGPATLAAVETAGRPVPQRLAEGIEIDLARQVVLVVAGGEVRFALNTSTGRSGWRTHAGEFRIERQIDGMRHAPLGDLWRPKYFNGGQALHGSPSIPAEPASHGCARLTNAAMNMLWSSGLAEIGTAVSVY